MISRFQMIVWPLLVFPLLVAGCGQDSSSPAQVKSPPPARQKVQATAPVKGAVSGIADDKTISEPKGFVYNPMGKRDPFQTLMEMSKSKELSSQEETPLQKYALNQLRIIGVVWGKGEPQAMVVAPDGKSFILKKGVKVGKNDGIVIDITKEDVLVEERIFDFSGTSRSINQKIPLPTTKKE